MSRSRPGGPEVITRARCVGERAGRPAWGRVGRSPDPAYGGFMSGEREWVLLCECWSVTELHTVRASLEAHGLPVQVQGAQTHGVLGMVQGAAVRSRILVPRAGLALARELAEEVIGPFDAQGEDDGEVDGSPFRREGADPSTRSTGEAAAPPLRRKSVAVVGVVGLLALMMLPCAGLAHIYIGRNLRGGLLLVLAVFAFAARLSGAGWSSLMLVGVGLADMIGGILGALQHNAALAEQERAQGDDEDDEEDGGDELDEDDEDDEEDDELDEEDDAQ